MSIGSIYKTVNLPSAVEQDDGLSGIPLSFIPARVSRAIPSKKSLRQIQFQSGQTAGPGQTSIVSLPFGNGASFMTANSAYLYFKLNATQAIAVGNTWGFKGSQPSASALINRLTVSCGSTIESINNYNLLATNVVQNFSNFNSSNIETVAGGGWGEANYTSIPYRTSLTTASQVNVQNVQYDGNDQTIPLGYKYAIPIISGFLSGGSESNVIPLCLLNAPLQLQIDWSTISQAFYAAGVAPTNYAISELSIVYETVDIGEAYVQSLKSAMAGGKMWSIPLSTVVSVQTQYTASLSYNMALNSSSVSSFFYGVIINGNTQNSALTSGYFTASVGSTAILDASNVQRRLFADGNSVYNLSLYNSDALLVRELVRSLSGVINPDNIKMPFNTAGNQAFPGSFRGQNYLISFNLRSFNDSSVAMSGMPVSTLNLQTTETATINAGDNATLFAVVDIIAVIDASGSISLIR